MSEQPAVVCNLIAKAMEKGCAIPFLGSGASLPGRPEELRDWRRGRYPPSGRELARYLAREYGYPPQKVEPNRSLVRIAQFADIRAGEPVLFRDLHDLFDVPHPPNRIHTYLAEQPRRQRARGLPNPWPVIVTTNYDDRLERAFDDAREPYDLVLFTGDPHAAGPFRHRDAAGDWHAVEPPSTYDAFDPRRRPVILKLHGGIAAQDGAPEHFVITEDHYISYLARDVAGRLPDSLLVLLQDDASLVFLGYALEDWNVRVLLSRIREERHDRPVWWAIQRTPNEIDSSFWKAHDVSLVALELGEWVDTMRRIEARRRRADGK
jgi:hypothetical protein